MLFRISFPALNISVGVILLSVCMRNRSINENGLQNQIIQTTKIPFPAFPIKYNIFIKMVDLIGFSIYLTLSRSAVIDVL